MDFRIAIPSYRRAKTIKRQTLRMLEREGIPASIVDIFLSDPDELPAYRENVGEEYNIIIGRPGIHHQREFIHEYYPEGQRLLCIDDDVRRIKSLYGDTPLILLVQRCFEIAAEEGCRIWGIYPSDFRLQMQDRAIKGLVFCIGSFFGMTNWKGAKYPHQTTEDFTRTIYAYKMDGAVIRFEGLAPMTRYFKEPGGLQEYRTQERQAAEMNALVERFPDEVALRNKYAITDVRFKRVVVKKIDAPFRE